MNVGINASNIKSVGGISHIYNLIYHLRKDYKKKYSINKIIIWSSSTAYKNLKHLKRKDIIINQIKYDNIIYNLFWKIFYLNFLLKKNNCDIFFSLDGIVLRKFKKIVVLYQNLIPFNYQEIINYGFTFQTLKNFFTYYLYKISSMYADGYIILNNYGAKLIQSKLGYLQNKKIIPHGVSEEFYKIKRKRYNNKYLDIIYISPIDHYKHQWNVIEAIRQLNDSGFAIKLRLVGPVSNKQSYSNLYNQLKKTNNKKKLVFYYGSRNKKTIAKLMRRSDIYLFASSCESFGLTLLEGMASDLVVLSSKKSGLNLTSENKGLYFDPLDVGSIKKSILNYINLDTKIRDKNAKDTKKIAKKYSWKNTSNLTFNFLSKIKNSKSNIDIKKILNKNYFFKNKIKDFYIQNIFIYSYSINFFTPIALFFTLYLSGYKNLSVQYAIILSVAGFFTQIFSANARNLVLADNNNREVLNIILFRLFISFIILFIGYFVLNKFYKIDYFVLVSSFLLVSFTWIKEIVIASSENNKTKKFEFFFQTYYILSLILCIFLFYFYKNYNYLLILPLFIGIELVLRITLQIKKNSEVFKNFKYLLKPIKNFNFNLAFWSGFFLTLLNIFIRILVEINFTSEEAADYFFCFSLATFPGTIITSILGVSYLGKEKQFPLYFKFLTWIYLLILILSFNFQFQYFEFDTRMAFFSVALSGLIGIYSQSIRQLNIINYSKRFFTFRRDIFFFFLSLILLLIFIIFFKTNFIFFILISNILSLIVYLKYYNPLNNFK